MIRKIKGGFTLIELMVAVAVLAITSGLTLLTMNNYSNNQAQASVKSGIVANLRMARSLAKTMQKPEGFSGDLRYVEVIVYGNTVVEAWAYDSLGVGATYFSRNVGKKGVSVSGVASGEIIFAPYEGKLMEFVGTDLVPLDVNESREILVGTGDFSETSVIEIGPQGVVDDTLTKAAESTDFLSGTLLLTSVPPTPTTVYVPPTATLIPTSAPTSLPTSVINSPTPTLVMVTEAPLVACSSCGLESLASRACLGVYCIEPATCQVMRMVCGNNPNCYRGECRVGELY